MWKPLRSGAKLLQPSRYDNTRLSNNAIIITAVSCLCGLILVIGSVILFSSLRKKLSSPSIVDVVPEESGPKLELAELQEGYEMMLPAGFKFFSREETDRGYIVYRFRSPEGYRFTLAIILDESIRRFTSPPKDFSKTLVKGVPELSENVAGEVRPEHVPAGSMPATLFRLYQTETYRGITFIYVMVAMDPGKKIVMRIEGKYGGYDANDEVTDWPDHWYDSLLTLRHARRSATNSPTGY